MNCALGSFKFQRSAESPDARCSELDRNSHPTSNSVRRRTTGWEAPQIDVSRPVHVAGADEKETKRGKAMHVG
jgi:hypothetical protein